MDKQEKAIEMTEKVAQDVMRRRELKKLQENEKKKNENTEEKDVKTDIQTVEIGIRQNR